MQGFFQRLGNWFDEQTDRKSILNGMDSQTPDLKKLMDNLRYYAVLGLMAAACRLLLRTDELLPQISGLLLALGTFVLGILTIAQTSLLATAFVTGTLRSLLPKATWERAKQRVNSKIWYYKVAQAALLFPFLMGLGTLIQELVLALGRNGYLI